ncbi:LysR family transcriptional regulator [Rhizobium halophytocola]|uniref:DNA-binding transcriptional LysR family regulator n=1 Tax=Rhizobium halophytocola TaxID=735519 RepID=A0ABS4DV31_9HYPH|nr:LysR family transcriptional regulator [Rhizobium halophytocola]MBP1849554.1 DNA-binding transcriptional LysR family regulator [Rhizobium halophytocola]
MAFDWDDLRYFLSVARTGRLTAAAARMATDHATISRRVRALEEKLGAALFTRSPRGYTLTDVGESLLRHAEDIESTAGKIQNEIAGERFSLSGAVRIGAPDGFGAFFLAPRIGQLSRRNPELELQIVAMPRLFNLSKRETDIAISLSRPERGRLFSRKLTDYTLHVYAAGSYLAEHEPIRRREDLASHLLIGYIPELIYAPELDYIYTIGEALSPRLSSTSLLGQARATEAGSGLCILPDFMARHMPLLQPVLPETIELRRTFWLTAHQDSRDSARVQTVIQFLVEQVEISSGEFVDSRLPPAGKTG